MNNTRSVTDWWQAGLFCFYGGNMKKVNVLGTEYTIEEKKLEECDGYCDHSTKEIKITEKTGDIGDFPRYQRKVMRHELIHAFLFESGLHQEFGHDEVTIDWMAAQFPKMVKCFREAGCLE